MSIIEGKKAPAFSLPDENGDKIKLSNITGGWSVLYFYPRDDTPGCTIEACDFTSDLKKFEKLGAIVYGCSPDSPDSHQKFIRKYKLKIKLLSDPSHKMMKKYGAWGKKKYVWKNLRGRYPLYSVDRSRWECCKALEAGEGKGPRGPSKASTNRIAG